MSYLPPPPPNVAPYAPPPPPPQGQLYQQYPQQPGYGQQPPPPPPGHQNGYTQHRPPPAASHHQHTGHDRPQKSKMVITRYPRPPNRHYNSGGPPPGSYNQVPPPPAAVGYGQPPNWHQPPPPQSQPSVAYPPPPNYAQQPPPPHQYQPLPPPPQQQQPYQGYGTQLPPSYPPPPPQQALPHPPPQVAAYVAPPPPHGAPAGPWNAPAPAYVPHVPYSPTPTVANYQAPPAPGTPAQNVTSAPPPQATPVPPEIIKDRSDPTFYDGWDDGEFEYGGALWIPQKGDSSQDSLSLGQYIWHGPQLITKAVSVKIDEMVEVATVEQKYDSNHFVIASKYYHTEDSEGHEYVHTFQRIRDKDEWKERKDDPLYKTFTHAELHEDVYTLDEVFQQCLARPKEIPVDMEAFLEANLTGYFNGTKGGSGKNLEAENVLASLGVTGSAKPVFATPFPAYNPPPAETSSPATQTAALTTIIHPKPPTPAPRNSGFNPFKVSTGVSRQPTPRMSNYGKQPPPPSITSPQLHFSHPKQPTPRVSPMRQSPSNQQPTPSQISRLPPPPPPPPPPMHSDGNHLQRGKRPDFGRRDDLQRTYLSPREADQRSPDASPQVEPRRNSTGHREDTPNGPGTPAGSDFGDLSANEYAPGLGSVLHGAPQEASSHDHRKRKHDDSDHLQRKRNKPKSNVESAYQRRW